MSVKKFAIFGCGGIAAVHAEAVLSLDDAMLVGCADIVNENARKFSSKYNIKAYDNLEDILNSDIDVVSICTPSGTHADIAIKALSKNKNVIVEKPMAITVKQCDEVIEAEKNSLGKIMTVSQLRMSTDVIKAREIIRNGDLGKIILVDLNMRYHRNEEYYSSSSWRGTLKMDGGGALMNQGIHGVDLLQYILGPIKNIKSHCGTLKHNIEAEDTAVAVMEFESGALGVLSATTAIFPAFDREIKIHGTSGCLFLRENKIARLNINGRDMPIEEIKPRGDNDVHNAIIKDEHALQFKTFLKVLNGENIEYVDANEGKKAVEIIETIYKNSKENYYENRTYI